MKFKISDTVRVKATGRVAKIKSYRIDGYILHNKEIEVIQYSLSAENIYSEPYKEDAIELYDKFDNEFERGLCDFLIDIYLANKKIDLVKKLFNEKQLYSDS
jgi:hypothetical protein